LSEHPWIQQVEVVEGDATDHEALARAVANVDVAYYLLHSLMSQGDFESQESAMARDFGESAKTAKVRRIVYLGGM
jgi:uncharacterized protein YbjT (DUF2867 family)